NYAAHAKNSATPYPSELAVVIGQKARDVSEATAMDYVGGYALALDMTAREIQSSAKDRLIKKKVLSHSLCCLCNQERENTKHLFFQCVYSKEVWKGIKNTIGSGSLQSVCMRSSNYIWNKRNNRRFSNARCPPNVLRERLLRDLKFYLQATLNTITDSALTRALIQRLGLQVEMRLKENIECMWVKPDKDIVKLNTDGSITEDSAGIGGAIKYHAGEVLVAFNGSNSGKCILTQDLLAIRTELEGCIMKGFKKVVVASDSLHAVKCINKIEAPPWYCLNLVLSIQCLCPLFEIISFIHVYRETNRLADHLATVRKCLEENVLYFVPPLDLQSDIIVKEEVANRLYTSSLQLSKSLVPDPENLERWLKIDGEYKQKGFTRDMIFKLPFHISHISSIMTLFEGDVILTGTPQGVDPVKAGQNITAGITGLIDVNFSVQRRQRPGRCCMNTDFY
ncbi:hypothetical protein IFM89_022596, partial [Coptis chinensis]